MNQYKHGYAQQLISTSTRNLVPVYLCVCLCVTSALLALTDLVLGGCLAIFFILLLPVVHFYNSSKGSILTLAQTGFSLNENGRISSFKWSDIETFTISGRFCEKHVTFTLRPNLSNNQCYFNDSFPDHYGLGVEGLKNLLTERKAKHGRMIRPNQIN